MNGHIARRAVFEHWPLDADEKRIQKDGQDVVKELNLGPVDLAALKELEDHLRQEPLQTHMPQIEACKNPAIAEMIVRSAVDLGDKRRIGTTEFDRAVRTLPGMAYLLYLSLRRQQGEISPRIALKIFSDTAAQGRSEALQLALFTVTGFKDESSGNAEPGEAKPPSQKMNQ